MYFLFDRVNNLENKIEDINNSETGAFDPATRSSKQNNRPTRYDSETESIFKSTGHDKEAAVSKDEIAQLRHQMEKECKYKMEKVKSEYDEKILALQD